MSNSFSRDTSKEWVVITKAAIGGSVGILLALCWTAYLADIFTSGKTIRKIQKGLSSEKALQQQEALSDYFAGVQWGLAPKHKGISPTHVDDIATIQKLFEQEGVKPTDIRLARYHRELGTMTSDVGKDSVDYDRTNARLIARQKAVNTCFLKPVRYLIRLDIMPPINNEPERKFSGKQDECGTRTHLHKPENHKAKKITFDLPLQRRYRPQERGTK